MSIQVLHRKRGTIYTILGECTCVDTLNKKIVYAGRDNRVWTRNLHEFVDGRFYRLIGAPSQVWQMFQLTTDTNRLIQSVPATLWQPWIEAEICDNFPELPGDTPHIAHRYYLKNDRPFA